MPICHADAGNRRVVPYNGRFSDPSPECYEINELPGSGPQMAAADI